VVDGEQGRVHARRAAAARQHARTSLSTPITRLAEPSIDRFGHSSQADP
jgi:hypothetical protein